ncbi:winged helix-turn-helix transcriptional regulator [Pseudoroseomonas wenyumeiae]
MKLSKVTKEAGSPQRRWYEDACAAAHALDLVGERWALLVMRELMFGPAASANCAPTCPASAPMC